MTQVLIYITVLSGVMGTLFPPAIALIQQEHWTARPKMAVTLALCVVAAAVTVVGTGHWQGLSVASVKALGVSFGSYVVTSGITYDKVWQTFGVTKWIEKATTLRNVFGPLIAAIMAKRLAKAQALVAAYPVQADPPTNESKPIAVIDS